MDNYNLDIKRTFLSFAQELFSEQTEYKWNIDPIKTKVLITDKHVVNLNQIEAKRSIILSRGTFGWSYTSLGQRGYDKDISIMEKALGEDHFSDMIRGSVTFNCISQNGIVAEDMATILFTSITAFKGQFKKNGINQIMNVNIGEETLLKTDSSIEVAAVPVYVQFETQKEIKIGSTFYDSFYIVDQNGKKYYQNVHFKITSDGIIFFNLPESGLRLFAYYRHAITLENVEEELIGDVDGVNKTFYITAPAYTLYPLYSGIVLTVSGVLE